MQPRGSLYLKFKWYSVDTFRAGTKNRMRQKLPNGVFQPLEAHVLQLQMLSKERLTNDLIEWLAYIVPRFKKMV